MSTLSESPLGSPPGRRTRREFRNIHVTQILGYRLPPAGIVSILHRISGALLFLTLPFLIWLLELSLTTELTFLRLREFASSWWAKLILLALIWAFLHHLVAGIRYLVLDLHIGVDKVPSGTSALVVLGVSLALTLVAGLRVFGVF
jgi:succinate dehydrogenase / fumarate reductase cytochrome b subunit